MSLFNAPKTKVRAAATRVGCAACTLTEQWPSLRGARQPQELFGRKQVDVYFIGESPSEADDARGVPFSGDSGNLIRRELRDWHISYGFSNVVRCHTPSGRSALGGEVSACWSGFGLPDLLEARPKVIVPLGNAALNRFFDGSVFDWNAVAVPHKLTPDYNAWIFPLHHPSYLQQIEQKDNRGESDLTKLWRKALVKIHEDIAQRQVPIIPTDEEIRAGIQLVLPNNLAHARRLLLERAPGVVSIDLETTCLMPWENGAKILSASITTAEYTVCWLVDHPENPHPKAARQLLIDVCNAADGLIAHNAIFEQRWMGWLAGLQAFGWRWHDTMARPFAELGIIKGNRQQEEGIPGRLASLGKQTRLHFGFDVKQITHVDPLQWRTTPVEKFLLYNALDSKWCRAVWFQPLDPVPAIEVARQGDATRAMAAISWRGMLVDPQELATQGAKLETNIKNLTQVISRDKDVVRWESKNRTIFNPSSPDMVAKFFGLEGADEEALRVVDTGLSKQILALRKQEKLFSTYIQGIKTLTYPDGLLHPEFGTMLVGTGRTNSRNPNAQNMPKRENKELRRVVVPPKGFALVSIDYAQLEARGIAIATRDPTMLTYVWNDEDIHREWAEALFRAFPAIADRLCPNATEEKKIIARVRGEIKNGFVFPSFYGAGVPKCAGELQVPQDTLRPILDQFWRKYAAARKWQDEVHGFYAEHLYVETMTRRRRYGPLSWTEQLNSPIQGTGSDIVVDASIQLLDLACETNDVCFVPMVNIHDDLSFYLPLTELDRYIEAIARVMVTPRYTWCTVPLKVEVSVGEHNWSDQRELRSYQTGDFHPLPKTDLNQQIAALRAVAERAASRNTHPGNGRGSGEQRTAPPVDINAARRARILAAAKAANDKRRTRPRP